ncbi:hypothetical protein [Azospirillum sp.]|uniref:hypothetical protein n=1 Tax=Azospirillum sp. TaxID=34012 RepID=UPI002D42764D|nr:hypothetical protein [Azospirillum sp.]HYF89779.1 hypothetical protein [Azospirillum sp.]
MTAANLDMLTARIDALARPVALREADEAHPARSILPPGGRAWVGTYAWLIVWPIVEPTPTFIDTQCAEAERRVDEALKEFTDRNEVIDGYVVLALPEPPTPTIRAVVRRAELGTRICRKHVVWWNGEDWAQMDTITLVGLPRPNGGGERAAFPALPADKASLAERLRTNWKAVVEEHLRDAGLDPSREAEE